MLLLLDTHAFLWWKADIAVKRGNGKLEAPGDIAEWVREGGFSELAIEVGHAIASAELPKHHGDPFDRLLIAQARLDNLTLVTSDPEIARYDLDILDATT